MKAGIHPNYSKVTVKCACGASFETSSTAGGEAKALRVDVCSNCHPFYTGSKKRLDSAAGRVSKFNKRYGTNA